MSYLIFTLIFITGLLIVLLLSDKFSWGELLGLPFIIGLGCSSFLMFFLDAVKMGITYSHLITGLLVTILAACGALAYLYSKGKRSVEFLKSQKFSLNGLTLPWLIFVGFGAYLAYGITLKCLYWPPAEFDSIEGYDLLAKAIAHEGTIANSILTNHTIVAGCGPRLLYPPLFASCNAICYMSGMESPKLITALFFISGLIVFYSLIKRFVPHTVAAIATFIMMIAPEMFSNASFTLTNLPTAIYASIAVISFLIWREQKIEGFFYLSILALLFGTWTRSDAIVFYPGIMLILLFDAVKTKNVRHLLTYGILCSIPFILWHFYLTAHVERQQDLFFIKKLFYDGGKLHRVFAEAWKMLIKTDLYGIVFYLFLSALLLVHIVTPGYYLLDKGGALRAGYLRHFWIVVIVMFLIGVVLYLIQQGSADFSGSKIVFFTYLFMCAFLILLPAFYSLMEREGLLNFYLGNFSLIFLVILLGGWLMYTMLYYQMKDTDGSLFASGGWMLSGYKRGMFSFVPLSVFYCAANPLFTQAYSKLSGWISGEKS